MPTPRSLALLVCLLFAACFPSNPGSPRCEVSPDADGDGVDSVACGGTDCDDTDRNRYPGNPELCDFSGHDEDCDPSTFGNRDQDGDGYINARCANTEEGTGVVHQGTDCDDLNTAIHPAAPEVCDFLDNDCNGLVDDGAPQQRLWVDEDGDGFGAGDPVNRCTAGPGFSFNAYDCDDMDANLYSGSQRCANATQYQICEYGTWSAATTCPTQKCQAQPNGTGICL